MCLGDRGWVPEDVAEALSDHYRFHREVEHRVQMVADAQTHLLPKSEEGWGRIAGLMGRDEADIRKELQERLTEVHEMTEGFFAPDAAPEGGEDVTHAFDEDVIARWESYPAMRSVRAVSIFNRVRPEILRRLAQAPKTDDALLALDVFFGELTTDVQLLSSFVSNPKISAHLCDMLDPSTEV